MCWRLRYSSSCESQTIWLMTGLAWLSVLGEPGEALAHSDQGIDLSHKNYSSLHLPLQYLIESMRIGSRSMSS